MESLRLLIERGGVRVVDSAKYCTYLWPGKYDVSSNDPHKSKDSRGRTPLQLAAELGEHYDTYVKPPNTIISQIAP